MSKGLFSRLPSAAVFDHRLKSGPLRVLAALGVYADPLGNCHPSIVTIARRLNLTRRMVQLHLRTLEEAGYLVTATRARVIAGKGINSYQLQYPEPPDDAKLDFASDEHSEANPGFASPVTEAETVTRNPVHGDAKFPDGDAKSNVTVTRNWTSHKQPKELAHLEQPKNSPGSSHVKNVSGGDCIPATQPDRPRPPLRGQDVLRGDETRGGTPRRLTPGLDPVAARRSLIERIERIWNLGIITAADLLANLPAEIERPLYSAEADGSATDAAVSEVLNSARGQQAITSAERHARARRAQDAQ